MDGDHWRRALAAVMATAVLVSAVVFSGRLRTDFVPLDRSTLGPNLLASFIQWAVVLVVVTLLYPPWRRAVHRFIDYKLTAVHDKLDGIAESHRHQRKRLEAVHESLNLLAENHATLHQSVAELHGKVDGLTGPETS